VAWLQNPESIIELLIQNSKGILHDISVWCESTGNELISSEVGSDSGDEDMHVLMQKGVPEQEVEQRQEKKMTVIISTADLDFATTPLDRALFGNGVGNEC